MGISVSRVFQSKVIMWWICLCICWVKRFMYVWFPSRKHIPVCIFSNNVWDFLFSQQNVLPFYFLKCANLIGEKLYQCCFILFFLLTVSLSIFFICMKDNFTSFLGVNHLFMSFLLVFFLFVSCFKTFSYNCCMLQIFSPTSVPFMHFFTLCKGYFYLVTFISLLFPQDFES